MEDPAVTEIIVAEDSYTDQQLIDKLFDCDDADWNIYEGEFRRGSVGIHAKCPCRRVDY